MPFNHFNYDAILRDPKWLSNTSAWVEHIPFAFAAMDMLRPRVLVELGTHKGDSYLAFCQAVTELALPTRCFAVDTWMGDEQAGRYNDAVFRTFRAQHDPLYASFSTPIQGTFDDALARFDDASIDVLHLDGLHTYDAIKHDFEAWFGKLSPRAVVLFHDTAVQEGDFGVHQLWGELAPRYPHFQFTHGYGLGVLAVGADVPEAFAEFCRAAHENPAPVRELFAALGQRLELARALALITAQLGEQLTTVNQWRAATGQAALVLPAITPNGRSAENLSPTVAHQDDMKHHVDLLDESLLNLRAAVGAVVDDDANIRRHAGDLEQSHAAQVKWHNEQERLHQQAIAELHAHLDAAHQLIEQRDATVRMMEQSRPWRWAGKVAKLPLLGKLVKFPDRSDPTLQ